MQMYYLKDNKTGEKYELSSKKIFFARTIPTVSLVLYGVILAFMLSLIELSIQTSFVVFVAAYVVEIVLWFSNKCSVGNFIGAVLLLVFWRNIFSQIFEFNNSKSSTMSSSKINEVMKLYKSCENNAMFNI